ncbi:site-specific integrase [Vibrio sp. Vb5031]|uniref:tyrosine-type recombinase/integrase n=1 Tax=Vibrio TaxID=662 RepID=UPI00030FEE5D|nr:MULTISPECIES: site-specific integrase [Vibrio]MDF4284639.1 site-specific integrase [Vibrio parahaemolyticus]MCA2422691.1 site-specific integrase [Vibrio alginolyticus]MCA2447317.1 site-specific integrase [Vibrio alginolyticus]MDF4499462.1 site-specific integrase [Vibrio parahaemolyticus]MDF5108772.1 site-specific integrase [Vibrio parahaemolyticus]
MNIRHSIPLPPAMPLFGSAEELDNPSPYINEFVAHLTINLVEDAGELYEHAIAWLSEQKEAYNNFKAYRAEINTFLHWCWSVQGMSVSMVNRARMREYIEWCENPPEELIGTYNAAQFVFNKGIGENVPNFKWRLFRKSKPKSSNADINEVKYKLSANAAHQKLSILSLFFQYLNAEEYCDANPAAIVLKFGKYKSKSQSTAAGEDDDEMKFFSDLQWSYVMDTVEEMAQEDPQTHERTLFLVRLLYGTYCRISEIGARPGYAPVMSQFRRDKKTGYLGFYIPKSKGGKRRTVAVSDELKEALIRYRTFRKLPEMPSPTDDEPLFVRHRAASHGREEGVLNANLGIRQIREIIQEVLDKTAARFEKDGLMEDAAEIRVLTVHSIRHTGISHDIANGRPLQHVQADAGHESIDVTSRYLHTTRAERHHSAKTKKLNPLE